MLAAKIGAETPASCSLKIPMICSSEKRLRFMLVLVLGQSELRARSAATKVIENCWFTWT
jgi:hypothetical protein